MGLLGSNFVRAYRTRGEDVHVWNRTAARATALEVEGAKAFADPADAARGAARIHVTLADDAAVDEVLERTRPGFAPGVVIVDHTTTSAAGSKARAALWASRGVEFQHAPVFMGPQNALDGTGIMLVSGDADRVERLRPALEMMTGKLVYLGREPERAAAFKLFGNLFLIFMTAGLAEVLNLAKALDVKPEDAAALFETFNPAGMVIPRMKRMITGDFSNPSWELAMARKDARLMVEEGDRNGVPLPMLPGIAANMDRFLERGHAHDDWTVIAKDALSPKGAAALR
jgi:3-hydroxyisobutyrate dehydrogenase